MLGLSDLEKDESFKGFKSEHGLLEVKQPGAYYIYAQVFFEIYQDGPEYHNRVAITVNGEPFALMQTGLGNKADYGSVYTGGVIRLKKGDKIGLETVYESRLWLSAKHTFLGAYKIWRHWVNDGVYSSVTVPRIPDALSWSGLY